MRQARIQPGLVKTVVFDMCVHMRVRQKVRETN